MTTSRIEVHFDEWVGIDVYPDHAEFWDGEGPGEHVSLESARAKLSAALRAIDTMQEIHPVSKTAPGIIPPSGVGAAEAAPGGMVEPVKHSVGGGCSDRCSGGCRLPSSPASCGHCEPASSDPESLTAADTGSAQGQTGESGEPRTQSGYVTRSGSVSVFRDDVDRDFCRTCWYTGSECSCEQCNA